VLQANGYRAIVTTVRCVCHSLLKLKTLHFVHTSMYRGVDKSLARPGRKQARNHIRDARDFNNIETRAVIKFVFLQRKAPKEIHAILTETVACFLLGGSKNLSAPLYVFRMTSTINDRVTLQH